MSIELSFYGRQFAVTGGCSGIGIAVARSLLLLGAIVHVMDITSSAPEELTSQECCHLHLGCNVTSRQDCKDFFKSISGRLDGLVNCAGVSAWEGAIASDKLYQRTMDINVTGTWNMTTEALRRMSTQENIEARGIIPESKRDVGKGSIVNIGSGASLRGLAGLAAYTASKHAVLGLTRSWARDFPDMRINLVAPGATDTPLAEKTLAGAPQNDSKVVVGNAQIASIPKGRMAYKGLVGIERDLAEGRTSQIWALSDYAAYHDSFSIAQRKVAIVTGAASGIGKALATRLIGEGWFVACCDIQKEVGEAVVLNLGKNAIFYQLDVCEYDEQAKVFTQVWEKCGRLDALLANAGHSDRGSIYIFDHRGKEELPPKPALRSIKACYESFIYGVQLAIHFMRKNPTPGGQIVATSTIASVHPHQTFPEYCGAKAAINQFVRTAAPILKLKESITLNAVLPGIVITGAVPQASIDATKAEHITTVETVVDAYMKCLETPNLNGELIECSVKKHIFLPLPDMANGEATKRACTVWEPLFEAKHYERSDLPGAIP
ncbi:hypothetical protein N7456_006321 [Penicillium angulare]|uniref:Uncharacterized protein n=1 Tax=Penicillium angulare TaxID=116970 RepID=A0A9W9FHK3_9EURO|nr:hypothetical protein N7456_006321 [Penicillium angulare]